MISTAGPNARGVPVSGNAEAKIEHGSIIVKGRIWPKRYREHPSRFSGHHAVTFRLGSMAPKALITVETSDREIAKFLASQGADSNGGIPDQAWFAKDDLENPAPDLRASGSPIVVSVRIPGGPWFSLDDLVGDTVSKKKIDLRFVDNREWIDSFGSGCVVCLSSCPGSKIANRGFTIRENDSGKMNFQPRKIPFREGEEVEVRLRPSLLKKSS